jgi:hypothetical protein
MAASCDTGAARALRPRARNAVIAESFMMEIENGMKVNFFDFLNLL